jgi:hypothetical protein
VWLIDTFNEVSAKRRARVQSTWKALLEGLTSENIRSRQNFGPSLADPLVTESHPTSLSGIMARCEVDDFDSRRRAPSEMKPMCSRVWKLLSLVNLREKVSCVFLLILMFFVSLVILSLALSFFGLKKIDRLNREKQIASERYRTVESELNNEEANPLTKYGKKFGMSVGYQFDDSTTVGLKFGYYLSGINIGLISNHSESYELRYSPDHFSEDILSMAHANNRRSERITVVEGFLQPIELHSADGTIRSFDTVTGLRLFSSNDRWSDRFLDPDTGRKFRENFTGYTLGHIRVLGDRYVHQTQFVWFRTD